MFFYFSVYSICSAPKIALSVVYAISHKIFYGNLKFLLVFDKNPTHFFSVYIPHCSSESAADYIDEDVIIDLL